MAVARLLLLFLLAASVASGGEWSDGVPKVIESQGHAIPFRVYAPSDVEPHKLPLVVYLHGSSRRGEDNASHVQRSHFQHLIDALETDPFSAYLIAPQFPLGFSWQTHHEIQSLTLDLIESIVDAYPIDPQRIYLTGYSMGGAGTFALLKESPHLFAAGVPVAGALPTIDVTSFAHVPISIYQGARDPIAHPFNAQFLAGKLEQANAPFVYTETNDDHGTITRVYRRGELELYDWMFQQANVDVKLEDTFHVGGWKQTNTVQANMENGAFSPNADQYLHIEIDPVLDQSDRIDVNGLLRLRGGLLQVVSFSNDLETGDAFQILGFTDLIGEFDEMVFPNLDPGLFWDTTRLYSEGVIRVISSDVCDVNNDSFCNVVDVDLLTAAGDLSAGVVVSPSVVQYDLEKDGVIDRADLRRWLDVAATANGFSTGYLLGDIDLNGAVEVSDFLRLSKHFGRNQLIWSHGDLDGDGFVGFPDFILLSSNFGGSSTSRALVPESSAFVLVVIALMPLRRFAPPTAERPVLP